MDFLCKVCDQWIIENKSEYKEYDCTLRKRHDKSFYKKYTINIVKVDGFNKKLSDYISHHIMKFELYIQKLTFELKFNNIFVQSIETNYCLNKDINVMKSYLLRCFDFFILGGYIFCNINHITINSISDRCNMSYDFYINQPMQAVELRINMVIAKNPQMINQLDRNKTYHNFTCHKLAHCIHTLKQFAPLFTRRETIYFLCIILFIYVYFYVLRACVIFFLLNRGYFQQFFQYHYN